MGMVTELLFMRVVLFFVILCLFFKKTTFIRDDLMYEYLFANELN